MAGPQGSVVGDCFLPIIPTSNDERKSPAYILIPDGVSIPSLGATSEDPNPAAVLKWFTPDANWTWYVVEFDPDTRICYGLVRGFEREFSSFSLTEIEQIRGALRLPVERDIYWEPRPVRECYNLP
jgi:hypothetical protein